MIQNIVLVLGIPLLMIVVVFVATINNPKEYTSKTTLYTGIVSGNNMDNSPGVGGRYIVPSVFDNLITIKESPNLLEKVSFRLMAQHIHATGTNSDTLTAESKDHLNEIISPSLQDSLKGASFEETIKNLARYKNQNKTNIIYRLINSAEHHYSLYALKQIDFFRLKQSDIIAFEYTTDDPAICQNTLHFFLEEFIHHYKKMKLSETGNIIEYFEDQVFKAQQKLRAKEANLQEFRESNQILDYIEQVRAIALKKEDMEGEYFDEKMKYSSAATSVTFIEEELEVFQNIIGKNQALVSKKEELEKYSGRLALAELTGSLSDNEEKKLQLQVKKLRSEIQDILDENVALSYSKTGTNAKEMLAKWLENIIEKSKSEARLQVFEERKAAYQQTYEKLSPLGSEITRLEREVSVAEQEYLRMVESLNLAQLRKQNADLTTNLSIIDAPSFPLYANPSKRILLLAIAGILGLVLIVGILFLLEVTDTTLKNLETYKLKAGILPIGALPREKDLKNINAKQLNESVYNLITTNIEDKLKNGAVIGIASTQSGDGKSYFGEEFKKYLSAIGYEVALKQITSEEVKSQNKVFRSIENRGMLKNALQIDENSNAITLIEIPSLIQQPTPVQFLTQLDTVLTVSRANRTWKKAEKKFLLNLKEKGVKLLGVLNAVKLTHLEAFVGDIPRERSKFRAFIKRIVNFEFKGATSI